jgi:hypothetical protein
MLYFPTNTHRHRCPIRLHNSAEETAYLAMAVCPSRKSNRTKPEKQAISKAPRVNVNCDQLNTFVAMMNIMCLLTRLTQHMVSAAAIDNHTLNTSNLVSIGTEGNITPVFLDGSFIISIFEK